MRVLVVDDNPDQADTLAELLRLTGHDARACYSGPAALTAAPGYGPDACLLDLRMPGMDGWELAARLRPVVPNATLMAVTGELGAAVDPRASLFDRVFAKPPSVPDLLAALASLRP